jgi:hypothetical protein
MSDPMTKNQRLRSAFALKQPDRPPILGGWLAAPNLIQALTGCSSDQYYDDPFYWGARAEQSLDSDGVVDLVWPAARDGYRIVDEHTLAARAAYSLESMLEEIQALPDVDQIKSEYDEEAEYHAYLQSFQAWQSRLGETGPLGAPGGREAPVWCPADWSILPTALWYHKYGYENALIGLASHLDIYRKLILTSAETGRQRSRLVARAYREGLHPGAVLTGEDLCSQQGPLASPKLLRKEYWDLVEYAFEPLYEAGVKVVWHCDGNVRPILADVLACGVAGLQGFQRECGLELEWIADLHTRQGNPLLIFGPMQVTTTLPFGTPAEVRAEVGRAMQICRGRASLVFFTSNTITIDTPLENLLAYWRAVQDSRW